jgi:RHS repeat-associated protein
MKTITHRIAYLCLFILSAINVYAQDIRIKKSELPYSIPVIEEPSKGDKIVYQWLENNRVVENSNQINLTIPKGKKSGLYTYVSQVKCNGCTDWLSSNPFTVEIYDDQLSVARTFTNPFSVKFSPQKELSGYLEELITIIDETQTKLDISIYSIDNYDVYMALKRAVARGVQVRMLYDGASEDKNKTSGTVSHKLEEIGIDVKYVNKINHHKFIISDNNYLMTSSGNWNTKANWEYDESSLSIVDAEIILRYRAEFELLWNNSREFGQSRTYTPVSPSSLLNSIVDNPNVDAVFTTSNYSISNSATYGPTFSKIFNKQDVADKIVSLINQAQTSIKISANHLRSRPICEALIQKKNQNPSIDIKVYTDQQEYITQSYNNYQIAQRQQCLAGATTPAQQRDCLEENFLYSYNLILAGIDVRFKSYSYKWHNTTSEMMHHKYAIFDDNIVAVGSYNYSYNSETNSMENVVIFNNSASSSTVNKFVSNFNEIWNLGRVENYYNDLLSNIGSTNRYTPLLFPSVALTHSEYTDLKQQIETACPSVTHPYFKTNGQLYSTYLKGIGLTYGSNNKVVTNLNDNQNQQFAINYSYNQTDYLLTSNYQSNDNITFNKGYTYDASNNLTNAITPLFNVNFGYTNDEVSSVNSGQGNHTWTNQALPNDELKIFYNAPNRTNYLVTEWTNFNLPKSLTDLSNRNIQWSFDTNNDLNGISTANRSISYINANNSLNATTSDNNNLNLQINSLNNYDVNTTGTVATSINYDIQEQSDKKQALTINLNSTNVASGTGKTASINYLFDVYGRVVNSGNVNISRKPYSGEITTINNGNIQETRTYNDWSLLTEQVVKYSGNEIYKATYLYDGMQRIKQLNEIVSGITTHFIYQYNARGQLEKVLKNGIIAEQYTYDNFGNRTTVNLSNVNYTYLNNNINQTNKYSWTQSGSTKHREFNYNNAGQLTGTVNKTGNTVTSSKNFNYDIFGNLNAVTWATQNLEFKYDAFDRQIATYLNGAVKRKLVYGIGNLPIAELNENDRIINTFVYADQNTPILMRKGSVDYYIVSDIRGSVRMVVKTTDGNVLQKMEYDAFGKVLNDNNPGYTPFGYAGGLYEYRTDLVRFGSRDYFAEIGKWTAEDPIGFLSGGFNDYAYVSNDPLNNIDPSGLEEITIGTNGGGQGFNSFGAFKNAMGPAGAGRAWHHIVNQNPANVAQFGNQAIQNTNNIVNLPHGKGTIHNKITSHYLSKTRESGNQRVKDWLKSKDFQFQYDYGMDKLKEFGWYQ